MYASWIFLCIGAFSWNYKHCSDDLHASIPQACFNSVGETESLSNSLLPQDQYDLRVVTFNTFDWNAGQKGHDRIKQWLQVVLPTVDVIAFQEFGYNSLDGFVRGFGLTRVESDGGNDKMIYIRNNLIQEHADHVTYTQRDGIGMDHCNCGVAGYHRGVDVARILVGGRQVYLANNHGCVGGCGGPATAYGGSEIIKVLNEQGFFTNQGAHSIFLGDVNYWDANGIIYSNDPKGLCAPQIDGSILGRMSVRGKLQCGPGHDLDYLAYGRGFQAVKHYSFSGNGNFNGDSDHKAVMLDLVFTDGSESNVEVDNRIYVNFFGQDFCTASAPCSDGQSDCDKDYECEGDLICWERHNGETDSRYDTSGIAINADVCVRPEDSSPQDENPIISGDLIEVAFIGKDTCASTPCSDGQSDCDNDDECEGNLICWQRDNGETDPRYDTSGIAGDADVCIQQADIIMETDAPNSDTEPEVPIIDDACTTNEEIRVATYNILYSNCGGYYNDCNCGNDYPANYAANSVRPDVMGTQENGCQVDFGNDMGEPYEVVPPEDCQSCNHNAIYYNSDTIQYAGEQGVESITSDHYSIRMYSYAKMRTSGGFVFWLFNVHNPHEHGNSWGFQGRIAEQMIDKWNEVGYGEPAVFTGDFNPHKDGNNWEYYALDHGLVKVGESSGGVCGFCDQIYYSQGDFEVVSTQVHGSGGSDHNAYSAVLRTSCSDGEDVPIDSNIVEENAPGVGGWGGSCTCPDGSVYQVGDNGDGCETLACIGGTSGPCNEEEGPWSSRKVTCAPLSDDSDPTLPDPVDEDDTNDSDPTSPEPVEISALTDEFSGSSVDESKWEIMHFDASWKNNEKECYVPNNVKVENGNLVLTATERLFRDWTCGNQAYFSGSIESKTYFLHGSFEVRAKLPSGDGLWPAIWLLGDDNQIAWPACGEIDLMENANTDPIGSKATLHYGPPFGGSINLDFGRTPNVPLKEDFHTWKIIRTANLIVMLFDGVEFGRKTRSEILATNYPNAATMFDAPMRVIFNVAVGGGFTGIGNRPPDMSTWDKPTMEVDYIRAWEDETTPDGPDTSCMDTVVCDASTCASCNDRVDWLMENRGKTKIEAKQQVASEFPDKCNCDCMSNMACSGSSCYSCGDRIEWLIANEGKTQEEAKEIVEQEFPVECYCDGNTMLGFSRESTPEDQGSLKRSLENQGFALDESQDNQDTSESVHISTILIVIGVSAILLCFSLVAFSWRSKCKVSNAVKNEELERNPDEDSTEEILTEIFEDKM